MTVFQKDKDYRIASSSVNMDKFTFSKNGFPNKCNTNRYPLCHAYFTIKAASWKIKGNFDSIPCVNSYEETIFKRFQVETKECKLESQLSHKKSATKAFLHTLTFILLHKVILQRLQRAQYTCSETDSVNARDPNNAMNPRFSALNSVKQLLFYINIIISRRRKGEEYNVCSFSDGPY